MTTPLDSPTIETRAAVPTAPTYGAKAAAALHPAVGPLPEPLADALSSSPGLTTPPPPEWRTENMSPGAQLVHAFFRCGCDYGGDVEGHDFDFEDIAAAWGEAVLAESVDARHPIEAKVWAGTWGALGATVALALVTLLLERLDVIPSLLGGESPWVGALVMVLGVVLPPTAQFIRAYLAEHTARPADSLPVPGGDRV